MPRYIDADKALSFPLANGKYDHEHANPHFIYGLETYREWLEQLPTVSPDDARGEGKWLDTPYAIECSKCHEEFDSEVACCDIYGWPWQFCPKCGAKMEVTSDV